MMPFRAQFRQAFRRMYGTMSFLTIAGNPYKVARFRWEEPIRRGEAVRAFDNTLLDGTDLPKRKGSGELRPLSAPAAAALKTAIANPVPCGGDAVQGSAGVFLVRVTGEEAGPEMVEVSTDVFRPNRSGPAHWTLALSLEEV